MDYFGQQPAGGFTQDMDGFGFGSVDLDQGQGFGLQQGWGAASQDYSRRSQSYHQVEVSHYAVENSPEQPGDRKASRYLLAQESTHSSKRGPNSGSVEEQHRQGAIQMKSPSDILVAATPADRKITQNYSLECNLNSLDCSAQAPLAAPAPSLETCSLPSEIITVRPPVAAAANVVGGHSTATAGVKLAEPRPSAVEAPRFAPMPKAGGLGAPIGGGSSGNERVGGVASCNLTTSVLNDGGAVKMTGPPGGASTPAVGNSSSGWATTGTSGPPTASAGFGFGLRPLLPDGKAGSTLAVGMAKGIVPETGNKKEDGSRQPMASTCLPFMKAEIPTKQGFDFPKVGLQLPKPKMEIPKLGGLALIDTMSKSPPIKGETKDRFVIPSFKPIPGVSTGDFKLTLSKAPLIGQTFAQPIDFKAERTVFPTLPAASEDLAVTLPPKAVKPLPGQMQSFSNQLKMPQSVFKPNEGVKNTNKLNTALPSFSMNAPVISTMVPETTERELSRPASSAGPRFPQMPEMMPQSGVVTPGLHSSPSVNLQSLTKLGPQLPTLSKQGGAPFPSFPEPVRPPTFPGSAQAQTPLALSNKPQQAQATANPLNAQFLTSDKPSWGTASASNRPLPKEDPTLAITVQHELGETRQQLSGLEGRHRSPRIAAGTQLPEHPVKKSRVSGLADARAVQKRVVAAARRTRTRRAQTKQASLSQHCHGRLQLHHH